ncbi:MAG: patatin-like phospholipase family protein [Litoreibacter sp.]
MAIGLVLGGGAPNLPLMSGALLALDEAGVEFDVVSTTGAGMLIGLLYAAPKEGSRQETLKATREMGVHDAIYDVFPVNFKIFHKAGPMAEAYTKFHQDWLAKIPRRNSAERFVSDMTQFWMSTFCPSDLSPTQNGMCQPPPWIDMVTDFDKLKDFEGEFLMSAYCIEESEEVSFTKDEITSDHFKAALAMPLIYAPYKMNGKTYLEGSAFDTLAFDPGGVMSRNLIDTVIYFDILGQRKLISEPKNLYDAWVHSIINPLTRIAELDTQAYEAANDELGGVDVLRMPFRKHISDEQWPKVLDWSYSNMSTLFDIGYKTGQEFVRDNKDKLETSSKITQQNVTSTLKESGVYDAFLKMMTGAKDLLGASADSHDFEPLLDGMVAKDKSKILEALVLAARFYETPTNAETTETSVVATPAATKRAPKKKTKK